MPHGGGQIIYCSDDKADFRRRSAMTVMDDLAEAWSYANNRPDQISEDMLIGQLIVS